MLLALLACMTVPAHPMLRLCGFYWMTGRPCPLCGMTRALFALGKGHWSDAIHFHALSPLGFCMLFSLFGRGRVRGSLWSVGVLAFVVYGVVRLFADV
jgi:hypothetical protein